MFHFFNRLLLRQLLIVTTNVSFSILSYYVSYP